MNEAATVRSGSGTRHYTLVAVASLFQTVSRASRSYPWSCSPQSSIPTHPLPSNPPIFHLPSPISHLPSPISHLPSQISHLRSQISDLQSFFSPSASPSASSATPRFASPKNLCAPPRSPRLCGKSVFSNSPKLSSISHVALRTENKRRISIANLANQSRELWYNLSSFCAPLAPFCG